MATRKRSDGTDSKLVVKKIDELYVYIKGNLKKFDQKSLRHSIRKVLETHALLDMQRDVRNEQGRSGSGSSARKSK